MIQNEKELEFSLVTLQNLRRGRKHLIDYAITLGLTNPEELGHVQAMDCIASDIEAEIEEYRRQHGLLDAAE